MSICSYCNKNGHNRRTCQALREAREQQIADDSWKRVLALKQRKHKKSLQSDPPPAALPIGARCGPVLMKCGHWSFWKLKKKDGQCWECTRVKKRKKTLASQTKR